MGVGKWVGSSFIKSGPCRCTSLKMKTVKHFSNDSVLSHTVQGFTIRIVYVCNKAKVNQAFQIYNSHQVKGIHFTSSLNSHT